MVKTPGRVGITALDLAPARCTLCPALQGSSVWRGPCGRLGHGEPVLMSPSESELLVTVVRLDWFPPSGLLKTFPSLPSAFCDESNSTGPSLEPGRGHHHALRPSIFRAAN